MATHDSARSRAVRSAALHAAPTTKTISTGSEELDLILDGGLRRDSFVTISGPPGAGKTILAQAIAFAAANAAKRVIYFTNVSEPHEKLVEHLQTFDFFTLDLLGTSIKMYNLASQVRDGGLAEALDFVVDIVRHERADVVFIDSFRGLKHTVEATVQSRRAIFNMGAQLAALQCTCILIGEYTAHEVQTDSEFAIADTIIHLVFAQEQRREYRALRVVKMRGSSYLGGDHSYVINHTGVQVHPRLESLPRILDYSSTDRALSTGISTLDQLLHGGLREGSSTLLAGPAGAGKTLLSLNFLAAGAAQREPGLMVSFQESVSQLVQRAHRFGLGEQINVNNSYVQFLSLSHVELDVDRVAWQILALVEQHGIKRVVIDSAAEIELAINPKERFDDFIAALTSHCCSRGITTLITHENARLFGAELAVSDHGLSYIADNVILLRYFEVDATVRRALTVLKTRGSAHDKRLMELVIEDSSVTVGRHFREYLSRATTSPPSLNDVSEGIDGTG